MTEFDTQAETIDALVRRHQAGDDKARQHLIHAVCERMLRLTRAMKRDFAAVERWEQTEDVAQRAMMRLFHALQEVQLTDARHFLRLAAMQIRRELIDLSRHYAGPLGMHAHHATALAAGSSSTPPPALYEAAGMTDNPAGLAHWNEFHDAIDRLPPEQRETVELLFYHEVSQEEAARLMGVSTRTVKRYWREARLALHDALGGQLPGID
jgi:RNA polymerase sigma-70 factor (ECF subfamily)